MALNVERGGGTVGAAGSRVCCNSPQSPQRGDQTTFKHLSSDVCLYFLQNVHVSFPYHYSVQIKKIKNETNNGTVL